ncbi:transglutaminaseTgpA domain-containing protein [Nocardioides sp. SYSU DS0651]|uniref:transglutaminase family protein n=1 Tax=Nocardioides sp. SYSU DS0651 TaxID=3415955 RepID=UPI003F4BB2A7
MGRSLALGLVAAATTWAALTSWRGFLVGASDYLAPLILVVLLVAVSGALLRSAGTPRLVTVAVQVALTSALVTYQVTGSPLPVGPGAAELTEALRASVESARLYAAPIQADAPPVWPLLLVGGAVFALVVDLVACTFRQVPGAGLALLAVYSVPSGLLEEGPGWGSFLVAAVGFLAMLHLDAREQLLQWGRPVGPADGAAWHDGNPVRDAVRAGVGRIGVTATALALVVPAFIPVLDVDLFDMGAGSGGGDIRIRKPIADMRRDLQRDADIPLIRIRTDDPAPQYLRVSVLNRYTGDEWSSGDRDVASDNRADGRLPDPVGLSPEIPRREFSYDVEVTDQFDSTWLPTQFPAAAVEAEGDWRFDPATMDFLAADDDLDTRGLSYQMRGVALDYGTNGKHFRDATTGAVGREALEVTPDVPAIAQDLADSVTAPATNDYERALLLQRWFRRDGGFTYDLRRAPEGTGNETLATFLSAQGRVGYCEQYASAMAVMARLLGIPARVAVGFLQPDRLGDGTWEYSSHDLHAWPELYFAGAGWVRFEPTPAGRVQNVPDYSRVPVAGRGVDLPDQPTSQPSASAGATTVAPGRPTTAPPEEQEAAAGEAAGDESGLSSRLLVTAVVAAALLALLAALALGPRAARARARRTRLDGGPDEVWAELHATAVDLGVPWPDGRSPREVGSALAGHLADPDAPTVERPATGPGAAPEAADALDRVVSQVERSRYARPGAVATMERTGLQADAATVIDSLAAGVAPRARQRAEWLPRSLWRRR